MKRKSEETKRQEKILYEALKERPEGLRYCEISKLIKRDLHGVMKFLDGLDCSYEKTFLVYEDDKKIFLFNSEALKMKSYIVWKPECEDFVVIKNLKIFCKKFGVTEEEIKTAVEEGTLIKGWFIDEKFDDDKE